MKKMVRTPKQQPTRVPGHKTWWKLTLTGKNRAMYQHYDPKKFGSSKGPYFIIRDHPHSDPDTKYEIYRSGASKSGNAKGYGGARTLKEAIKRAERLESKDSKKKS